MNGQRAGGGLRQRSMELELENKCQETAADNAKAGCPISKLLNAKITMEAKIEV